MFCGYRRCYSLTQTLLELGLPSFDTVISRSKARFQSSWSSPVYSLVQHLISMGLYSFFLFFLWPPYVIRQAITFLSCGFFLLLLSFFLA